MYVSGVLTPFDRFKRVGPNAMRGRGIGTARGRATIMRGQPFILLSTHLLTCYIANGPLSCFPCIFLVANIVAFISASWTRRTSTSWYSKMIHLIQSLFEKSSRNLSWVEASARAHEASIICNYSKALKTEYTRSVLSGMLEACGCRSFKPTTFNTEFWTCIYISQCHESISQ
jgi:hypothetical protein